MLATNIKIHFRVSKRFNNFDIYIIPQTKGEIEVERRRKIREEQNYCRFSQKRALDFLMRS